MALAAAPKPEPTKADTAPQPAARVQAAPAEAVNGGSHAGQRAESSQAADEPSAAVRVAAEIAQAIPAQNEWAAPVIPENRWVPLSQPESQTDNVVKDMDIIDVFHEATEPEAVGAIDLESVAPVDFEEVITNPSQEIDQPEPETEAETEDQLQIFVEPEEADISDTDEAMEPMSADNEVSPIVDARTPEQSIPIPSVKISFEITPRDVESAAAASEESIRSMLDEILEPLEPEAAQTASELVDQVAEILTKSIPAAEDEPLAGRQKLEEVIEHLFAVMDIQYNEETLAKFISSIQLQDLSNIGTHEKKIFDYLIIRNLSVITQKSPSHIILGRYALGMDQLIAA